MVVAPAGNPYAGREAGLQDSHEAGGGTLLLTAVHSVQLVQGPLTFVIHSPEPREGHKLQ